MADSEAIDSTFLTILYVTSWRGWGASVIDWLVLRFALSTYSLLGGIITTDTICVKANEADTLGTGLKTVGAVTTRAEITTQTI